ncbi:SIS domain-containing protein [Methanospirillum sp. J.3.6.1-F.2.7.3]|uniref:SIS domain-containing protein n=3 Tax=Methanospirillum TaxID=2202 RepID=A0A8E7B3N8_9EURY|nr:SIS domain-containing protein [Methanospirillum sp. J.3.6.1-F.2.7.3]QXO96400.1 SIS domain-containing protein [Methanospirillum hungatei]
MLMMISRIGEIAQTLQQDEVDCFISELMRAERIFVVGAGRSGFVAKSFAMRLMHLGFTSYVVGETVTPAFHKNDTLIAFSGSGKTKSVLEACETTKQIGGNICLITGCKTSPMTELASCVVLLSTEEESCHIGSDHFDLRQLRGEHRSIAATCTPLGTLFETSAMIFADSVVSILIEMKHCTVEEIMHRYTNMQ